MATRTVVFVHGNPETAAIWRPLTAAIAARGRTDVVALSPPGFGAPVPDGFDPTMDNYADWLVGELEAIRATGTEIDLLGHDWGAGHVYGALARRPDLVRTWAGDCRRPPAPRLRVARRGTGMADAGRSASRSSR